MYLVPTAGVEPAQLPPLPPQDSVSTNSTTSAIELLLGLVSRRHILCGCIFRHGRNIVCRRLINLQ